MINLYIRNFKLGQLYLLNDTNIIVKFIQVTKKGFNLLNIKNNKCILRHHLYSKDWSGKDIPKEFSIVKNVWIRSEIYLKEIDETKIFIKGFNDEQQ